MIPLEDNYIKRANAREYYTKEQLLDFERCCEDPLFFMSQFVRVQHPTKGSLPFEPYQFQKEMISAYEKHRFNVSMCSRQMGKCVTFNINVLVDDVQTKIGSLIPMNWHKKLVTWLEKILLKLI